MSEDPYLQKEAAGNLFYVFSVVLCKFQNDQNIQVLSSMGPVLCHLTVEQKVKWGFLLTANQKSLHTLPTIHCKRLRQETTNYLLNFVLN